VALATGRDVVEQLTGLLMDDGELRWISVNARALREEGEITGVVTTFVDVTEQRAMVAALADSEAAAVAARDALTVVLDATTQYAIIGTDQSGLITVFNGGAERMLGYGAAEVVGRHHPELFHDPEELQERAAELGVPVEDVLGHGARQSDTETRDWTFVRRDGVKLPVSLAITAIRGGDGSVTGYLGIGRDITAERQAARELRDAEDRFRNAFDQAPIGKALVSPDGRFTRVNSALCKMLGYSEQQLLATTFQTLTHPDDLDLDLEQMGRVMAGESESYAMEKRYEHADGRYVWSLLSVSLVRDESGAPAYFVSQIQDISEQRRAQEHLTDLSLRDALTGLANRVLFGDRLAHAVERSRRSKERVAVLFVDFDRFKAVNDTLGHAAGDELLRQAAERMQRAVRPADTIARLGGDEFTVLCEDLGALNDAGWVADRLSEALERPFELFGSEVRVGVSIGIAVADRHDSAETVLAKADAAMYRTKNDRRDVLDAA
jgi:diguanylate cyclase (GGDEF)-like protein/PAS domain S-box-containing protein